MADQPKVTKQYLRDRTRKWGHRKGRPKSKYNYHPSRVGEFPHKDTGNLRRNINEEENLTADANNSTVRVGTNVPYAKILELSRGRLLFKETLNREAATMKRILEHGTI